MKEGGWDNALAVVVTLQAVLPAFLSNAKFAAEKIDPLKERVRCVCECVFLANEIEMILHEVCITDVSMIVIKITIVKRHFDMHKKLIRIRQNRPLNKFVIFVHVF